mmetsp:Transcript_95104/g.245710  ORF Transcript_95104/g.245710 Transcript_95104/m.245710 type:complete len:91 (+) Transcript_95104:3-275(+)
MAEVVVENLRRLLAAEEDGDPTELREIATSLNQFTLCSLGPNDGVFVSNGSIWMSGWAAAAAKGQLESTKMGQYRQEMWGSLVWRMVPHW